MSLDCRLSGAPAASWSHNGKPLKARGKDIVMEQEGDLFRLKLAELFPEDSGCYTCEAGDAVTACTLLVKGEAFAQ